MKLKELFNNDFEIIANGKIYDVSKKSRWSDKNCIYQGMLGMPVPEKYYDYNIRGISMIGSYLIIEITQ